MRKIATILISMLLVLIPLSASTDEAVLDIKAYKLGGAGEFTQRHRRGPGAEPGPHRRLRGEK